MPETTSTTKRNWLLVTKWFIGYKTSSTYLRPVSSLSSKSFIHHVSDGEPGHGTLSEGDDLIDGFHYVAQPAVSLQSELSADLKAVKYNQRLKRDLKTR